MLNKHILSFNLFFQDLLDTTQQSKMNFINLFNGLLEIPQVSDLGK